MSNWQFSSTTVAYFIEWYGITVFTKGVKGRLETHKQVRFFERIQVKHSKANT